MREQIDFNDEVLEDISGGKITYSWSKKTQSGSVSSSVTGQTFTFGADKANEIFQYVMAHKNDPEANQMNAILAIING